MPACFASWNEQTIEWVSDWREGRSWCLKINKIFNAWNQNDRKKAAFPTKQLFWQFGSGFKTFFFLPRFYGQLSRFNVHLWFSLCVGWFFCREKITKIIMKIILQPASSKHQHLSQKETWIVFFFSFLLASSLITIIISSSFCWLVFQSWTRIVVLPVVYLNFWNTMKHERFLFSPAYDPIIFFHLFSFSFFSASSSASSLFCLTKHLWLLFCCGMTTCCGWTFALFSCFFFL